MRSMTSMSPTWEGFENIKLLNPQFAEKDYDVLCLPENIEFANSPDKLIQTMELIEIYKIMKSQGVNALTLHDFGVEISFYDRRCDEVYLGTILIKEIAIPVVATILSNWISGKLSSEIHLNLKIQKPDTIISINYKGDGETLKYIIDSMKNSENDNH